jgi:hypothetical protein
MRVELLALHSAQQYGQAQFYMECAQIRIAGSGSNRAFNFVSFPGAYQASDPGIQVNIYDKEIRIWAVDSIKFRGLSRFVAKSRKWVALKGDIGTITANSPYVKLVAFRRCGKGIVASPTIWQRELA